MIEVRDLGIHFDAPATPPRWIFKDLSFTVQAGETVGLLGPSGSGKSLLLKIAAGLIAPSTGAVKILTADSRDVGMLFQKGALFDSLSAIDNLLFPLRERRGIKGQAAIQAAQAALRAVGLEHAAGLHPDELSGGMQKRLGLARALIVQPKILLLDEPTAGLDPVTSRSIGALIERLSKESGTTTLMVTNELHRAYQLCDRIFILAQGELHGGQAPAALQSNSDPLVRQFLRGETQGPLSAEPELAP